MPASVHKPFRSTKLSPNQTPPCTSGAYSCTKSVRVSEKETVATSVPFVDKITITGTIKSCQLSDESRGHKEKSDEAYTNKLAVAARNSLSGKVGNSTDPDLNIAVKYTNMAGFSGGALHTSSGYLGTFGISRKPSKKGGESSFTLRIEFNPAEIGKAGLGNVSDAFDEIFAYEIGFARWLSTATITRIDTAVDIYNVELRDLLFGCDEGEKWSGYFGNSGEIETWSRLAAKSKKTHKRPPLIVAYDKRKELLDNGISPAFGQMPYVRVERRQRNSRRRFINLGELPDPLAALKLGYIPMITETAGKGWRSFHALAMRDGLELALEDVEPSKRSDWRHHLENPTTDFWDPDLGWTWWHSSLRKSGLAGWVSEAKQALAEMRAEDT